jgi:transposase-like protein
MDLATVQPRLLEAGDVVVVMDTTYFGHIFGVMVWRCPDRHKNLLWKFLKHETVTEYVLGIEELRTRGWNVTGIVCDAKKGLTQAFPDLPVQMCQFHQIQIVLRYITRKPKLEAGKDLKALVLLLTKTDEASFRHWLTLWHEQWKEFLVEKTVDEMTKRWHFTHRRLRSAYRSLETNFPWLFTFEHHPHLSMPNTTNSLEGIFAQMKKKISIHPGLRIDRKQKLIRELLGGL